MTDPFFVPARRSRPDVHLKHAAKSTLGSDEERYLVSAAVAESLARELPAIVVQLQRIGDALERLRPPFPEASS